jgi:hypothetical protein
MLDAAAAPSHVGHRPPHDIQSSGSGAAAGRLANFSLAVSGEVDQPGGDPGQGGPGEQEAEVDAED